jgi:hypothetical protein
MNNLKKRENQFPKEVGFEFASKNSRNFRDIKKEEQECYENKQFSDQFLKSQELLKQKTIQDLSSTIFQTVILYQIFKNAYQLTFD